jgi:hypothetical protein
VLLFVKTKILYKFTQLFNVLGNNIANAARDISDKCIHVWTQYAMTHDIDVKSNWRKSCIHYLFIGLDISMPDRFFSFKNFKYH